MCEEKKNESKEGKMKTANEMVFEKVEKWTLFEKESFFRNKTSFNQIERNPWLTKNSILLIY